MTIEVLVAGNLPADNIAALEEHFLVHVLHGAEDRDAFLAEIGPRVRALVVPGFGGYRRALLDALPAVEMVSVWGAGTSELDLDAARERGIVVTVTPDNSKVGVAELGMALLLATARWIPDGDRFVRSGRWATESYPRMGIGLAGRHCGIVGLGTIGSALARRAAAFDMKISYNTRRPKPDMPFTHEPDLQKMARECDFLVLCCPNTPETRGLVDAPVLQALGPGGVLVNIARGPVVDEAALIRALESGGIRGAGLDVFEDEPNVPEALRNSDRVVLSAHIGTQIEDVREKRKRYFIQNLQDHFAGRPIMASAIVLR